MTQRGDWSKSSEKLLCNRCPLKYEARESGRGEMLYETDWTGAPPGRTCTQEELVSLIYDISGMGVAIHNRVYNDLDPRYGCSHPMRINKETQARSQPSGEWVIMIIHKLQPGSQQTKSKVLCSISTQTEYKSKHVNTWVEVEHAWTSSDYQPMMKTVNRCERYHQ